MLRNGCTTFSHLFQSSPPSPLNCRSPFVYVILDARLAQAHARETYSRVLQIPNARRTMVSISPASRARSYTTACIYTSYIITPDGASTSRTLGKAPHDSVYLLNTEYNVSPAYTWTLALPPLKETYPEGPFTLPHMVETREVALHNEA